MEGRFRSVMMKPQDNVAVALTKIPTGVAVEVTCREIKRTIEMVETIDFGHKFAVQRIERGEDIIKYGEVIGMATREILPGAHVHIHNLEGKRGRGDKIDHTG